MNSGTYFICSSNLSAKIAKQLTPNSTMAMPPLALCELARRNQRGATRADHC